MEEETTTTTTTTTTTVEEIKKDLDNLVYDENETYTGQCKWFSNKLGYGYVTAMSDTIKGTDFFVHFSDICPTKSSFKTLINGEYINFKLKNNDKGPQASHITGVEGGQLMCDLYHERRQNKEENKHLYPNSTTEESVNDKDTTGFQQQKRYRNHNNGRGRGRNGRGGRGQGGRGQGGRGRGRNTWNGGDRNINEGNTNNSNLMPVYMNENGQFFASTTTFPTSPEK